MTILVDPANKILIPATGRATTATGFLTLPGTAHNWAAYARPRPLPTCERLEFVVHVNFTTLGVTASMCGWANAYASFLLDSTNKPQMYFRGTATRTIGNTAGTAIPGLTTGTWVWLRGRVTRSTALCEYWYDFGTPYPTSWTASGSVVGTFPNEALSAIYSDIVLIGQRSSSGMVGKLDYFEEWVENERTVVADFRNADVLPDNVYLRESPTSPITFTPRTYTPDSSKRTTPIVAHWIGNERVWPPTPGGVNHVDTTRSDWWSPVDAALAFPTNEFDIRWFGIFDKWYPASGADSVGVLIGVTSGSPPSVSARVLMIGVQTTTVVVQVQSVSLASGGLSFGNGGVGGIRVTRTADMATTTFMYSTDGVNWYTLSTSASMTTAITNGTGLRAFIGVPNLGFGQRCVGRTIFCEVRSAIDGPIMFKFDARTDLVGIDRNATTFTTSSGHLMTKRNTSNLLPPVADAATTRLYEKAVGNPYEWPKRTYDYLNPLTAPAKSTPPPLPLPDQFVIRFAIQGPFGSGAGGVVCIDGFNNADQLLNLRRAAKDDAFSGNLFLNIKDGAGANPQFWMNGAPIDDEVQYFAISFERDNGGLSYAKQYNSRTGTDWRLAHIVSNPTVTYNAAPNTPLEIGSFWNGATYGRYAGRILWAEMIAGLDPESTGTGSSYTDDFNRADGSLGSNWTHQAWSVVSNKATKTGGGSDYATYIQNLGTPDHYAEADVVAGSSQFGVVNVRRPDFATNPETGYLGFWNPDIAGFTIGRSIGGSYASLASGGSTGGSYSGRIRLEVEGSTLRLYSNGVLQVTTTDSSITTGNYAGINANPGPTLDNFACGTLSGVLWRFDAAEASGASWTDPRNRAWTLTDASAIVKVGAEVAVWDVTDWDDGTDWA